MAPRPYVFRSLQLRLSTPHCGTFKSGAVLGDVLASCIVTLCAGSFAFSAASQRRLPRLREISQAPDGRPLKDAELGSSEKADEYLADYHPKRRQRRGGKRLQFSIGGSLSCRTLVTCRELRRIIKGGPREVPIATFPMRIGCSVQLI